MTEAEFNQNVGSILQDDWDKGEEFVHIINLLMDLLDEGDMDDFFGTEGWRHHVFSDK